MNTTTDKLITHHARLVAAVSVLDIALTAEETTHTAMPIEVVENALADLYDIADTTTVGGLVFEVLSDYRDAVTELLELRAIVEPKDPAAERRRILGKAEKLSDDSGAPDRVRALIELAAEWGRES